MLHVSFLNNSGNGRRSLDEETETVMVALVKFHESGNNWRCRVLSVLRVSKNNSRQVPSWAKMTNSICQIYFIQSWQWIISNQGKLKKSKGFGQQLFCHIALNLATLNYVICFSAGRFIGNHCTEGSNEGKTKYSRYSPSFIFDTCHWQRWQKWINWKKDVFGSISFSSHFAPRPLMSFAHWGGGKTRIKREWNLFDCLLLLSPPFANGPRLPPSEFPREEETSNWDQVLLPQALSGGTFRYSIKYTWQS